MSSQTSLSSLVLSPLDSVYHNLLNRMPAAFYLCDAEGYITYYNEAAAVMWGRRPEIGKDLWCGSWKIYHPDGTLLPLADCPMAETLKTKKAVIGKEIIVEQPNGRRFHVLPYPQPVFDEAGALTGAMNMLVDVTDQANFVKLQQHTDKLSATLQALRKSEERFHRMVAEVQDYAILLLSADGTIEQWNTGAEKIKGYKEEEVLGKHIRIFYPPEDQATGLPERLIQEASAKGSANHEGWRVRKDGTRFWGSISITALHDASGEVVGFSKVTRDLTERRKRDIAIREFSETLEKKNELLRQSEERYHRMVAEVEDYVIILLSVEGTIQNWNKGAEKIKGYTADEIVGQHFSVFYSADDRAKGLPQEILMEAVKNGKAVHEGWRLKKNGSAFWGSVVMTALHTDDGTVIGFTKVTRDLTEKKLAEDQLLKTSIQLEQKNKELERINEELSSFAYISSHDLQEPLRKIQTFSDRIMEMEYNNLSEKGKDYFRRMQAGALRMQKLIKDILTYSRTTTSEKKLEVTDLNDIIEQTKSELEVMITEKNAVIQSDRLPVLKVIPFQVQQLFYNLLNNALKFSRDVPARISIKSETVHAADLPEGYRGGAKRYCHISISDNGIGFEQMYERKIFEVFQRLHGRTEYDGTGIGLAICKKIVENHNGFLSAEGVLNEGSTFHVYLPLDPD